MVMKAIRIARRYILNVLVALDQLASALIGGDPDETISSRLGKAVRGDYGRFQQILWIVPAAAVDLVFLPFDGPDHCRRVIEEDEGIHAIDWEKAQW
jgi:hypothetical protein